MPLPVQPGTPGTGLKGGAAHDPFPAAAQEVVRNVAPWESARHMVQQQERSGGATRETWVDAPDNPVDARLDATGAASAGMRGGALHEDTTHIVTFREPREVKTADRVVIEDREWSITALRLHTGNWVQQVEVVES